MWYMICIITLFAFCTAVSSSSKRSVADESTPATEFEVRLAGGFAPYAGQVTVYHQGVWSAVCDKGWDENDALVVCRELGYPGVTMVTRGSHYGSAARISIEMMRCYGNETRLSQCAYETPKDQSECKDDEWGRGAGVICEPGNNTEDKDVPKLRLSVHPDWEGAGLVEVFIRGEWGRVCDSSWYYNDAEVVCRQLGYPGAQRSTRWGQFFGKGSGPALMDDVECTGSESSLFYCPHVGKESAWCDKWNGAGVICKLDKPEVRLVGSPLGHAGFVQIRHYGRWGSFCDWSWGLPQAHVVCRELGYRRALFATIGRIFEKQSGDIWVEEAVCFGNETSIFDCDLTYVRDIDEIWGCNHDQGAGVICESNEEPGLNETAVVRIRGANFTHMGGVEIKQHGIWHAVCSIGWDKHDADVVCRQLGFPEAVVEVGHGQFTSGEKPMFLTSVRCHGNETSLDQCVSAGWELEPDCEKKYGAGVICKMDNITDDGELRLHGSNATNEGRVEIKLGGIWGTISERDWDIRDGHVVCRQLGYHRAVRVYSHSRYGDVDLKIWLSELYCNGEERSLLDCPRELNYDLSASVLNAGVECSNDTDYRSEVEVRLVGLKTSNAGHVQVKYNGTWGTMCAVRGSFLTYQSAEVICRQVGQGPPLKHEFSHKECTATNQGAEKVWLSDLNCQGFENSIDECPHRGWGKLDPEYCRRCTPQYCSVCLICQPRNDTNNTDIALRLVGSNLDYAGRVEVRYAGVWGLICPRHLNTSVFRVICRQLGFADLMGDGSLYGGPYAFRLNVRLYGKGSGPIWLSKVRCHGNESSLSQCEIDSPGEILWCIRDEALALMCLPKNYTPPYPVRLAGTSVPHAGRVEVFYNGSWGTVCSGVRQWDYSTANALVFCRQLGFGKALRSSTSWLGPQFSNCPAREHATGSIWLSEVQCRGNESSIDQCPHLGWGDTRHHCGDHTADACLVCYNPQYKNSEIAVQLTGSEVSYAGRVKVRYQGVWGTLCAFDWKHETAEVLCRQLGYEGVELDFTLYNEDEYLPTEVYDEGPGPVWFNSDGCNGNEKTLSECNLKHDTYCSHDNVELICKVDNVSVNEFAVRLNGGNHSSEGRVEVFYGGLWGTVSSVKWDLTDALVVCRQLGFTKVHKTYNKKPAAKRVIWFREFECQGREATLGQCRHMLLAKAFNSYEEPLDVFVHCGEDVEGKSESTKAPTKTSTSIPRVSPTATLKIPRVSSQMVSSTKPLAVASSSRGAKRSELASSTGNTELPTTLEILPTQISSTLGPLLTSVPSTVGPPDKCRRCQNGGSCERVKNAWKCQCLEDFAGEYCEVYVGSNAVSIVLKMTLDQWNPVEFKRTVAEILTSHCSLNPCLDEDKNTKTKSQKKSPTFQPDDVIILQGYPKAWQGMNLLNVRFAIKTPGESENIVIPHEILSELMVKVAPEMNRRMGHGIAFIDKVEIQSGQSTSTPPEAAGRNSDEPESTTPHKYALITLGVLLGIVCLVAIVIFILYRRKTKREKTTLREDGIDEKPEENIRLMPL